MRYSAKQSEGKIVFTNGADYYEDDDSNITLKALGGNDTVKTWGSNVKIYGGAGNDTIKSYSNLNTTYLYKNGDGNDIIDGFDADNDKIKLTRGTIKNYYTKNADVIFKIGLGSITVKGGRGKKITVENANGTKKIYSSPKNNLAENYFSTDYVVKDLGANGIKQNISDTWFTENNSTLDDSEFEKIISVNEQPAGEIAINEKSSIGQFGKTILTYNKS